MVVHPIPEFMNLPPDDIENGARIALVEKIQGIKKQVSSLRLVFQGTHVLLQYDVHKPELWRYLHLVGDILVPICKLPLAHVSRPQGSKRGNAN